MLAVVVACCVEAVAVVDVPTTVVVSGAVVVAVVVIPITVVVSGVAAVVAVVVLAAVAAAVVPTAGVVSLDVTAVAVNDVVLHDRVPLAGSHGNLGTNGLRGWCLSPPAPPPLPLLPLSRTNASRRV